MNKHMIRFIVLALIGVFNSAQAAVLNIKMPNDSDLYTTSIGAFFDANIYINSVADFAGFDFDVTYDSSKLSALSLNSASIFGAADTDSFSSFTPGTGSLHFAETISFTSALTSGLDFNVPTLLGTIHFQALDTAVNSLVTITNPELYDFPGNLLGGSLQGAFVTIEPAAVVPLPTTIVFFLPSLLALFGLSRKKAPGQII